MSVHEGRRVDNLSFRSQFYCPNLLKTLTCGFIVSELSVLDPDFIRFNSAISPGKLDSYISCFSTRQDG